MSLPPSPPEPAVIRLPAHCVTGTAPGLQAELLAAIGAGQTPFVDGSEVESLGQAVLQLLLAVRAACPSFLVSNPSPALADRLRACALGPAFGLEQEA